ncbi:MAG: hypothetical protein QOI82_3210 [Actinomycetota bacterium]|jgi:UDP:flavonoid glycosyltransferase YjiC (YdhE family)|nr:hypothetical protein [Actinomycetota bacterium]
MRVLFTSTPGYGHVYPMVPLARAFLAAGHDVLWAASEDVQPLLQAAGLPSVPSGLAGSALQQRRQAVLSPAAELPGPQRAPYVFPRMFGEAFTPPMAADLLPLARSWRPDLLVHEQGELAGPLVAALLDVPSVTHSFGGPVPEAILADTSERLAELWADHGLGIPPYAGCFTTLFLDIVPPEAQTVSVDHIPAVQPLRPVSYTGPEPTELPGFLAHAEPPLVYLTLGTVHRSTDVMATAVSALAQLPVRVLVTVGPNGDPAALGSQPGHVAVERYVPQTMVLPRCAVVVSHAGSGTFLGALAVGVPQLCLPQAADQFRNAEGGARCGAAITLTPDAGTPEAMGAAVEQLLDDPRYQQAALRQAAAIADMPSPAEVVDVLARLS